MPDYNPEVADELLRPLGKFTQDSLFVLVTVSVPKEIKNFEVERVRGIYIPFWLYNVE